MSTKLKVGVVGAGGAFNMLHSDVWEQHPEIEIVAICDINREKAEATALKFNNPRIRKAGCNQSGGSP